MRFGTYYILLFVLTCFGFPSDTFGQFIRKEAVGGDTFAVIYAEGMAKSAQWVTGFRMMRNGTTIRHQVSGGNGGNVSVNDKIPMRFIVAKTDLPVLTWMQAEGGTGGSNDLNADFAGVANTGCRRYGSAGQPGAGRTWRVPTQRELQLMWLFRQPIGVIYQLNPMEDTNSILSKKYWSSTEKDAGNAWIFDFKKDDPHCFWQAKSTPAYVRCVSDY